MGAVAEGFVAAFFAAAPGDALVGIYRRLHGTHAGIFSGVGTVAEGLLLRFSARAPEIISGLHFLNERFVLLRAHVKTPKLVAGVGFEPTTFGL